MKIELEHVRYMPKQFKPGVLYVSEECDIAMRLCPPGAAQKSEPLLGPTEWSFRETDSGPSLDPSAGIGSKRVNRIIGSIEANSDGPRNGRPNKSPRAAATRKNADVLSTMASIVNAARPWENSGVGRRACLSASCRVSDREWQSVHSSRQRILFGKSMHKPSTRT